VNTVKGFINVAERFLVVGELIGGLQLHQFALNIWFRGQIRYLFSLSSLVHVCHERIS